MMSGQPDPVAPPSQQREKQLIPKALHSLFLVQSQKPHHHLMLAEDLGRIWAHELQLENQRVCTASWLQHCQLGREGISTGPWRMRNMTITTSRTTWPSFLAQDTLSYSESPLQALLK
jgi:hypothetical protein